MRTYIKSQEVIEDSKLVKITGPIDRVYEVVPSETHILMNEKPLFTIERENFKDVVVWNPYIEGAASMGDFEPKDGWKNMVYPRSPSFKLNSDLCRSWECGRVDANSCCRWILERKTDY